MVALTAAIMGDEGSAAQYAERADTDWLITGPPRTPVEPGRRCSRCRASYPAFWRRRTGSSNLRKNCRTSALQRIGDCASARRHSFATRLTLRKHPNGKGIKRIV